MAKTWIGRESQRIELIEAAKAYYEADKNLEIKYDNDIIIGGTQCAYAKIMGRNDRVIRPEFQDTANKLKTMINIHEKLVKDGMDWKFVHDEWELILNPNKKVVQTIKPKIITKRKISAKQRIVKNMKK